MIAKKDVEAEKRQLQAKLETMEEDHRNALEAEKHRVQPDNKAKMLDRVDRAEVNAALKSAIFSFFIKSAGSTDDLEAALSQAPAGTEQSTDAFIDQYLHFRENNPVFVDGAQVTQLFPGEDVVQPNRASPNSNYPDFARFVLQKVAGSLERVSF